MTRSDPPCCSIRLEKLQITYQTPQGEIPAIESVDLEIQPGEFVAIVGPSGCGKTTILSALAGLLTPTAGCVFIDGKPVCSFNVDVGYMLQQDYLLPWRTVRENARLGLEIQGRTRPADLARVERLLRSYGLCGFQDCHPHQLSGGMRQRVALARTLALEPRLLLLDEPFSALDYQTRIHVQEEIYHVLRKRRNTIVMVTHDIGEAVSMADRIVILSQRPTTVRKILSVPPAIAVKGPWKARRHPAFPEIVDQVWSELKDYVIGNP